MGQISERLGSIDRRLDAMDSRFNWVIGIIVGTWVTLMATQITSGNAAKYFDAVLGVTISTTLISYLLILTVAGQAMQVATAREGVLGHLGRA